MILEDVIGYQEYPNDYRQLGRSTMWRWVGTLGRLKNLSQTAHRLLLEFNPASFVSRHLTMLAVPAPGIDVITANYPPKKQEKALACTALSGWSIR